MSDWLDKIVIKLMIWRIKKGWGANCRTLDYEDFPGPKYARDINVGSRCGSCAAKQVIQWLESWQEFFNRPPKPNNERKQ